MLQFQPLAPTSNEPIHTPHSALAHHPTMVQRESTFLSLTEEPTASPQVLKQRRPSNFLILAPVTSDSYPSAPKPRRASISSKSESSEAITASPILSPTADVIPVEPMVIKTRRSTSVSSTSSSEGRRLRFLKLNPVHWGGEEGDDDYAIEE